MLRRYESRTRLAVRNDNFDFEEALLKREYARQLIDEVIPLDPPGFPALDLSVSADYSVYDTLFVAAAAYTDTTLPHRRPKPPG